MYFVCVIRLLISPRKFIPSKLLIAPISHYYYYYYGILAKCKSADEFVRLSLVKSFCLPLLCYCIGSLDFTSGHIKDLAVCWNDCFRRIFGFKRYESVKLLQFYCKELPFEYIVELYKWKFLTSRVYVSDRFIFFYEYNVHVVHEFYNKYALPRSSSSSSHMKCVVIHFALNIGCDC